MTDQSFTTAGAKPTDLPPLPEGFTLDVKPVAQQPAKDAARDTFSVPSLPEGFKLDQPSASPVGDFKGVLERGNIDLAKRPKVKMDDGSIATVRSMSFDEDGKEILVPTVSDDGKILSNQEAIDQYHKTGKHLGIFDNADDATAYAQALHQAHDQVYGAKNVAPVPVEKQMEDFVRSKREAGELGPTTERDNAALNIAKGAANRIPQITAGALRTGAELPNVRATIDQWIHDLTGLGDPEKGKAIDESVHKQVQQTASKLEKIDFGYKPGTTWEDVKKSPAKNFIGFAVEQGLVSAPDMAAALTALPAYVAARAGELGQQRAKNNDLDNMTAEDLLYSLPAATVSALLDRIGGRGMFGLDEAAVQGLKQLPKAATKAAVKEGATEAAQQVVEDVGTDAGTKKGFDPWRTAENALASAVGGSVFGAVTRGVEGAHEIASHKGEVHASDLPPLPEGFTLDPTIQKTNRLPQEGKQGETVETAALPRQAPVARDDSGDKVTPPESPLSSVTPEERAILRRSAIPDADIDVMSRQEVEQKVSEARAANISVNQAMIRKAAEYAPPVAEAAPERPAAESVPIPEARPVNNLPIERNQERQAANAVLNVRPDLEAAAEQSVAADRQAQIDRAVSPEVQQALSKTVEDNIAQDRDQEVARALAPVEGDLAQSVQQSVDEDMKGDGTRQSPVVVQQPAHVDAAAQQVNTNPSDAQKIAGNYAKGHIKVSGIDVTLENPKGSIRSGTSTNGTPWQVEMPAHYGYVKRTVGRDGDQVDAYIGDNPQSKRVYVIDQKDLGTRRFDEHKAVLGVNSVTEARNLYARAFSDNQGADRIGGITPMSVSEFRKWLASGDTTKPLAMGKPKVRLNDEGFPIDANGNVKKPESLIEFLARKGGVKEETGELSSMGLRDRKAGFVVGAGPLIRRNGLSPDKAREAAAEAGYLPMDSTVRDFYDALDQDARSGRQTFSQYDDDWASRWREAQGGEAKQAEEDVYRGEAFDRLKADGFPVEEGADYVDRVAAHMANGQSYEDAVELAYQDIGSASAPSELADIPFFGDETNEAYAGTAPVDRAPSRAESKLDRRSGDAGSTQARREAGPVRGESGPEAPGSRSGQDGGRSDQQGAGQRQGSQPQEPVTDRGQRPVKFSTSMGSTYTVHEDGTTTRDKAERKGPGHEGDKGLKPRTAKTIYTDANAGMLSAAGLTDADGRPPQARVAIRDGKATLVMWNNKAKRWGASEDSRDIRFFTEPAKGRYPLELWKSVDDVPGYEAYANMHAGNKITDIVTEPTEETGADKKPQLVIPGAERATDATMAQRGADAALKPKVAQKEPGGLFSDEQNQGDLLDLAKKPEARPEEPKKLQPPPTVYHGTSTGGFDTFDTYQGKYGLFGTGGYFTEDPNIALEYTSKGRGKTPTVYSAKLNVKNALDMDAKADVKAWEKAFPDYFDADEVPEDATNEQAYRAVEENLSQEMIPDYEGAETMQDGVMSMGYDAITHVGGGRHKASKGTKHRVWIVFDPEQVTDFKQDSKLYQLSRREQEEADGVKADLDDLMAEMAAKEERKRKAKERSAAIAAKFKDRDKELLSEVVKRVAGIDPEFADTLDIQGSRLWGSEKAKKAVGQYNATDDVITLALDLMNWDAANHEAFHRLQNLFLTDRERAALRSDEPRLRQFLVDTGMKPANVAKMARVEVEAEAFSKWVAKRYRETYDAKKAGAKPVRINTILRKAWDRLGDMLRRVKNFLNGRGYQTYADIFGAANEGKIKERTPRETGTLTESPELYSVDGNLKTETPEFKEWFGDSKVVDRSGKPLVVNHGTYANASANDDFAFEEGHDGADPIRSKGYYFSSDRWSAKEYAPGGDMISAYLSLRNPLDLRTVAARSELNSDIRNGRITGALYGEKPPVLRGKNIWAQIEHLDAPNDVMNAIAQWAEDNGYDGLIFDDANRGSLATSYVAFSPSQIKAVDNRGTFDPNDPRILHALADDRAPAAEPETETTTPEAALGNRINDYLNKASKALASKIKSKGSRFDRSTADDNESLAELAHRKIVDYLSPVKRMQEKVGGNLNDTADAYLTARLAEGTIRHEIHQIDEKYVTPAVEELARVGASLEDLHKFMYAMHAPERNRVVGLRNDEDSNLYRAVSDPNIRGASGMSTNEARDTIRQLQQDREKFMGIRRAASHIRAMLDNGLETQLRNGLINRETYDRLTQQWQHYVPLRAESAEDGTGGSFPSKSRGFDVRGDEFKGATGRFTPADNVVVYAINNAEQSVIRGEKNKAATAALRFINQFDPQGENIAQVYWTDQPEQLGDITKAPAVYKRVIGSDGKVTQRKVNDFQMRDDVLAAKVGGKTYYMKFADPKVGLALKKMTFSELGVALKMVKTISNWQSLINTRANPAFIPLNLIRDVQTGATLALSKDFKAGEIAKMVGNIPNAWGALWRHARGTEANGIWDTRLKDFMASGAKTSFDQYNSIEDTLKKLQKDMARRTGGNKAMEAWRSVIKLVEDLNDTIENGMRLSVFNASRQRGETSKRAAFLARDLTVDFQKKGEVAPAMNALYTFFNASVQGNFNFAKGLAKSRKVQTAMMGLMAAGFAQHLWNLAMAGQDDDGENAYLKMLRNEPWKLERSMVFFLPGRKDYVMIPLGFGLNAFWHLGMQGGAVTTGDKGFLPAALDSTRVAFDAFNPLGSGGWVSMALPSIIDPIWELGTNQNFTGNPIYPNENKFDPAPPPKSQQAFKSTSPVFKTAAETMNKLSGGNDKEPGAVDVYPDSLEYLWGWFTGGVGRFVSQSAQTAQNAIDLKFEPKKTPFVRSFYGSIDDASKRAEYYNEREKVQYAKGKMKEYEDTGDKGDIAKFRDSHKQDLSAVTAFDMAEKQRRKFNKDRRSLEKSKRPQSEINNELDRINDLELEVMNDARKQYFKAGRRPEE
jgi:hypothetical protein